MFLVGERLNGSPSRFTIMRVRGPSKTPPRWLEPSRNGHVLNKTFEGKRPRSLAPQRVESKMKTRYARKRERESLNPSSWFLCLDPRGFGKKKLYVCVQRFHLLPTFAFSSIRPLNLDTNNLSQLKNSTLTALRTFFFLFTVWFSYSMAWALTHAFNLISFVQRFHVVANDLGSITDILAANLRNSFGIFTFYSNKISLLIVNILKILSVNFISQILFIATFVETILVIVIVRIICNYKLTIVVALWTILTIHFFSGKYYLFFTYNKKKGRSLAKNLIFFQLEQSSSFDSQNKARTKMRFSTLHERLNIDRWVFSIQNIMQLE